MYNVTALILWGNSSHESFKGKKLSSKNFEYLIMLSILTHAAAYWNDWKNDERNKSTLAKISLSIVLYFLLYKHN